MKTWHDLLKRNHSRFLLIVRIDIGVDDFRKLLHSRTLLCRVLVHFLSSSNHILVYSLRLAYGEHVSLHGLF